MISCGSRPGRWWRSAPAPTAGEAVYVPKAAAELEPMLRLWPSVLAVPTALAFAPLDLVALRAFPVHPLGVMGEVAWADGRPCSPAEYFFHDLDHARYKVREDLRVEGVEIPDAYQDGTTVDAAHGPAPGHPPRRRRTDRRGPVGAGWAAPGARPPPPRRRRGVRGSARGRGEAPAVRDPGREEPPARPGGARPRAGLRRAPRQDPAQAGDRLLRRPRPRRRDHRGPRRSPPRPAGRAVSLPVLRADGLEGGEAECAREAAL